MLRLERRGVPSRVAQLAAPFGAMVFTLAVTSLLVAWAGAPVGKAYALLLEGGFGSRLRGRDVLTRATPLILTGLAAAVAFRARLCNIGAEGQLHSARSRPWPSAACTAARASRRRGCCSRRCSPRRLAGAVAAAGAGADEVAPGVDEVVTTLLLNFIVRSSSAWCSTAR